MRTAQILLALAVISAGTSLGTPAVAEEPAVSEVNVQIGASQTAYDFKGSPNAGLLSGSLAVGAPLGERVGIRVLGERARGEYADQDADSYETFLAASMFLRRPEIGSIGVGVGNSSLRIANRKLDTDYYRFDLSAYLSSVTLAIATIEANPQDGANYSYGAAQAGWYVDPNLLLSVTTGLMDAKETYGISLEQQTGQGGFAYSLHYGSNFDRDYDLYSLDLNYRLARPKSLMDRHRKD